MSAWKNVVGVGFVAMSLVACGDAADDANNDPTECAAPQIIDQPISEDEVWVAQGGDCTDYLVTQDIKVSARLDIEPGVNVLFEEEAGLKFETPGHLVAEGSADEPITMLGTAEQVGWWQGIRLWATGVDHSLAHVIIDGGGLPSSTSQYDQGFALSVGSPGDNAEIRASIVDSIMSGSVGYGLLISSNSVIGEFSNNTLTDNEIGAARASTDNAGYFDDTSHYSGNTDDVVHLTGGVNKEATLKFLGEDAHYRLGGAGNDPDGHRALVKSDLTIEPGVTIASTAGSYIKVETEGSISAIGSEEAPITFTGTKKEAGHWNSLDFYTSEAGDDSVLEHVIVEYGGGGTGQYRGLLNAAGGNQFDGSLTVKNSEFRHSERHAIYIYGNSPDEVEVNPDICTANSFSDIPNRDCRLPGDSK